MKLKLTALLLLAAVGCFAQAGKNFQPRVAFTNSLASGGGGGGEPSAPSSPLVAETFEGAGYSGGSWAETPGSGTINEDYTSEVLVGSQSLYLSRVGFDTTFSSLTFSETGEVWGRFKFRYKANIDTLPFFSLQASDGTLLLDLRMNGGKLRVDDGLTFASAGTVDSMVDDTIYYITFHYQAGSGANGVVEAGFSTDGSRPTSGNKFTSMSNSARTQSAGLVQLGFFAGGSLDGVATALYDNLYIDDATF